MTIALGNEEWQMRQLVKLERSQPAVVRRALQRLFDEDEYLRWSVVVGAYLDTEISLARAAAMLQLHPLELRKQLIAQGIPLQLGPEDVADAQAEIDVCFAVYCLMRPNSVFSLLAASNMTNFGARWKRIP
jgi:predicted HTH domain antitoxin